jgi:hypothetical protein
MAEVNVRVVDLEPVKTILLTATELATAWARMPSSLREAMEFADPMFTCHVSRLTHSLIELKGTQ